MMMGAKQAEFQLVEVENVSVWGYQVSDDARELDWTLEKPYHLSFSSIAGYKYIVMLTDSPFVCADTVDADVNAVSDFNVFVPAIGKYSVGQTTYNPNRDLPAGQAESDKSGAGNGYPQSEIYDSLGRKWIKIAVAGNALDGNHKTISYKSMSVYYCVENDLGKVFPERRWDKHYYYKNLIVINNRDKRVTDNYFDGLKYNETKGVILQATPNDAPAYYGGNIEGYLIEIPDNVDQVQVFYQGTRSYVARITNNLGVTEIGWNQNSYLYTPIAGDKYLAFTPEYPNNITTLYMVSWTEW
jgi:hypothetical protein